MNKIQKFEGVRAIAFVSIMASITILLIFLTSFFLGVGVLSMILIPLVSSFVSLKVNWKYRLIYFCASIITFFIDPSLTIFIVIPSLISGILIGELVSKYIQGYYIIFLTSICVSLLQILSTYLIDFIYQVNMIELFSVVMHIDIINFSSLYYFFIFILSIIQVCLSYMIITNELKKLDFEFNEKKNQFINIFIYNVISICISILTFFLSKPLFYLFLGFSIYFGVILGFYIFSYYQKKKILIIQIPLYFISLLSFCIFFDIVGKDNIIIFLLFPLISQIITSIYIISYQKIIRKGYINETLFD